MVASKVAKKVGTITGTISTTRKEPVCKISGQKEGILRSGMGEIPETPVHNMMHACPRVWKVELKVGTRELLACSLRQL